MRSALLVMSACLVAACGDDPAASDATDTSDASDTGDGADSAATATDTVGDSVVETETDVPPIDEFVEFVGRYDLLETVAGLGAERDMGVEWLPSYEGGPATAAELSRPHMAMADLAGNIFIADKEAHAVRKVDPSGIITTAAGTGVPGDDGDLPGPGPSRRLGDPNGLWVRPDGVCYILDLDNGKIRRLAVDGTMTTLFAVPGGIDTGRGLWVSDDERHAFVASGTEVLEWHADLGVRVYARGFSSLANLVLDPDGKVVVADRGVNRIFRLAADGSAAIIAGNGLIDGGGDGQLAVDTGLNEVRAVWFVDTGGYLVGTHEGNQVWYVDTKGVIHLFVDGGDNHAHSGDGLYFKSPGKKVSEVRAITLDHQGNILITENDYGYVRAVLRRK